MNDQKAKEICQKIFLSIFQRETNQELGDIYSSLAFDVKLPYAIKSSKSRKNTWAYSKNFSNYMTIDEVASQDMSVGWMKEKKSFSSLDEVLALWNEVNFVTTERVYDSIDVSKSDLIYRSMQVYHSANISDSKNIIFCNGLTECEWLLASSRSFRCLYSIRCDDSVDVTNSYAVICSNKISNSFFIQDCANLNDCLFCSHISNRRYCICNMQMELDKKLWRLSIHSISMLTGNAPWPKNKLIGKEA